MSQNPVENGREAASHTFGLGSTNVSKRWRGLQIPSASSVLAVREQITVVAELLVIALWSVIVTRPYLNLDPATVPAGREYLSAIQTHHVWTWVRECGWCALWNGSTRGGAPAFADLHGSMLHPLVILATLGWGVLNGSKLALVGAFAMAGLAQWWLGRVLGLGWIARVWSASLAVAGGHLAAPMELGVFGVVLSTAACALVLPPLVALVRSTGRRDGVLLGVVLALAAVAGQGYMQFGLVLSLPAIVLVVPRNRERLALLARRFALSGALAFLLAAPILVPFLHFLPEFSKDSDPQFQSGQAFAYVPLNLVIEDPEFYYSQSLGKLPYPYLYANFVGWVPVLLAIWGLWRRRDQEGRATIVLLATLALLALWLSSGVLLRWMARLPLPWLAQHVAGVRHPPLIAGLAIAPILGLAGIGLDELLRRPWPHLRVALTTGQATSLAWSLDARWLLAIPLVLALADARSFGRHWITTARLDSNVAPVLEALRTPDLQWVNPPFGEHHWIEAAVGMGLKLSAGIRTWRWKDRALPEPVKEASTVGPPPGTAEQTVVRGIPIYVAPPGREYAVLASAAGQRTVCSARGTGGNIDVVCIASHDGVLTVKENNWSGWQARADGKALRIHPGQWLAVDLPAGHHLVQFRYRPWDVPLGLLLSAGGLALAMYEWNRDDDLSQL